MSLKQTTKERAWGTRYDTLGRLPPSSSTQCRSSPVSDTHSPIASIAAERPSQHQDGPSSPLVDNAASTPHDASIFIDRLPASIDHTDLTQRLSEHFSAHPQVKAIKVVRDARGGVCGFIQCESPAAAGKLLQDLADNPPRPFCGRFLRFEAAKAFRTLHVSYRMPTAVAYNDDPFNSPVGGRNTNLTLARTLRIFRPRNAKHLGILYNSEALKFDCDMAAEKQDGSDDAFCGEGLLIHPLEYDEKNIRRIVSAFGPLESFRLCASDTTGPFHETTSPCAYPHDAPRSAEMSKGVWEVKWRNREDSVLALLTLRRIPHLVVSWAHRPLTAHTDTLSANSSPFAKGSWLSPNLRRGYPELSERSPRDQHGSPLPAYTNHALTTPPLQPISYHVEPSGGSSHSQAGSPSKRPLGRPGSSSPGVTSPCPEEASSRWADQVTDQDVYGPLAHRTSSASPSSGRSFVRLSQTARPFVVDHTDTDGVSCPPTTSRLASDVNRTESSSAPRAKSPMQPAVSTRGPRPSPVPQLNGSPDMHTLSHRLQHLPLGGIDPKTVFVGGLNVQDRDDWDENRLRRIFDRHGVIESVQIVRPLTKRTCFAFVQFANSESANRAVREEHNQVHDGRPLRVQLRDRNPPPQTNWRFERGRGRNRVGDPSPPQWATPGHGGTERATPVASQTSLDVRSASIAASGAQHGSSLATNDSVTGTPHPFARGSLRRQSSFGVASSSASSVSSSTTKVPSLRNHSSQGPPSTTSSPQPPASASSALPGMAPFPMNVGYFPPQPWVPQYHPSYAYPAQAVPGYAFPGYAYPHFPPVPSSATGRDAGVVRSNTSGIVLPSGAPDNSMEKTADNDGHGSHGETQPPLRPTGFIQNEHGALIPVYQREALDQYMASAHPGGTPAHMNSSSNQLTSVSPTAVVSWPAPPYPFYTAPSYPAVGHPYPGHPPPAPGGYWLPGGPPLAVAPFPPSHLQSAPAQPSSTPQFPATSSAPPGGMQRGIPPPNVHGPQHGSGQRGGYNPRRVNRRGYENPHGGNASGSLQYGRFPDRPGSTTHAFAQGP